MATDRSLTPSDAVVAVRSFPRRFRAALARPDDADERLDPDEVARRPDADGRSAVDHLAAATGLVDALPALGADDVATDGAAISTLLDRLDAAAAGAVARIDAVSTDQWSERLPMLQDAVGAIAGHLRAATRAMAEGG